MSDTTHTVALLHDPGCDYRLGHTPSIDPHEPQRHLNRWSIHSSDCDRCRFLVGLLDEADRRRITQ